MTQFGELSLWIALLMSAWCTTLAVQGAFTRRRSLTESAARGLQMALLFSLLAAGVVMAAFLDGDYALRYVAMHSGVNIAPIYKVCAFWSGRAGLLLLASVALAAAGSAGARSAMRSDADHARAAWTLAAHGAIVGAALAVTAFTAHTFAVFTQIPTDGRGLDPLFRHPLMAIQPLMMLAGTAAASVPLALIVAAAVRRRSDAAFVARLRAPATAAWTLLSLAFVVGARWAYVSPGLRARTQGTAVVIAAAAAWIAMMLVLIAVEVRDRRGTRRLIEAAGRRRAAWIVTACGALLCAAPLAARPLTKNYDVQIDDGSRYDARDVWGHAWTFTSQGESRLERPGDDVTALALLPTRDGVRQPFLSSESRQYFGAGGLDIYSPQTVPAIQRSLAQDLVVVLSDAGDGHAVLRVSFRPLIELAWAGGVLLALGGALLFWPSRPEQAA
ncbi:MAG: cytochrome c-type biogenesis CcmF C-terminal domain-containing protein [Gemmatimonadaceae bacterium]